VTRSTDDLDHLRRLGARLAEIRHQRNLSQNEVAERAGVDPQTIQRAETGRVSLSVGRLRKISTVVLGVPLSTLFEGVGSPVPEPGWSTDEVAVVSLWRRIPDDRRNLARKVLQAFTT